VKRGTKDIVNYFKEDHSEEKNEKNQLSVCDICCMSTNRNSGFILTTGEVITSQTYWRNQLSKLKSVLTNFNTRDEQISFLEDQAFRLFSSPSGWLVCSNCSQMFEFDYSLAQECATSGKERPDAGPSSLESALPIISPIILELVDSVIKLNKKSSNKKFYQCPGCGSVYEKDQTNLKLTEAGISIVGGKTCSDCYTRSDSSEIYSGKYDFDCDDIVIEEMLRDPDNAIYDSVKKIWTFKGNTIFGPASKREDLSDYSSQKADSSIVKTEIIAATKFPSVKIGNQKWMTENLNVEYFRNGDPVPEVKSDSDWKRVGEDKKPAWCYYDNDSANGGIYGRLYNWYAVIDPRGLAPEGWHVSSDEEWSNLIETQIQFTLG